MSPSLQEADGLVFLGLVVVLVDGDGELDFLDDDDFLLLARGPFALVFLVEEFAVVLNAADRRHGVGRDFHQIQAALAGNLQSFKGRKNAELLAVFVNDANFTRANPIVDADKCFAERLSMCRLQMRGTVARLVSIPSQLFEWADRSSSMDQLRASFSAWLSSH